MCLNDFILLLRLSNLFSWFPNASWSFPDTAFHMSAMSSDNASWIPTGTYHDSMEAEKGNFIRFCNPHPASRIELPCGMRDAELCILHPARLTFIAILLGRAWASPTWTIQLCANYILYTVLWYVRHAKLCPQHGSMDINVKYSIAHSHATAIGRMYAVLIPSEARSLLGLESCFVWLLGVSFACV